MNQRLERNHQILFRKYAKRIALIIFYALVLISEILGFFRRRFLLSVLRGILLRCRRLLLGGAFERFLLHVLARVDNGYEFSVNDH